MERRGEKGRRGTPLGGLGSRGQKEEKTSLLSEGGVQRSIALPYARRCEGI